MRLLDQQRLWLAKKPLCLCRWAKRQMPVVPLLVDVWNA
jgi:hypothetical protein